MPLLNKKPLELHRYNKKLKDDAEVFYCKCTNEIFEDYEEYCQRVISCNSLIWTCAITGKSNLTYQEALASEQNALKSIKDFPLELRTPVLYLASKTNRRNFNEMASDVFNFAKDRYFLGESVEACFDGAWVYGHVLQVMLPAAAEVEEYRRSRGLSGRVADRPYPGALYKYEVEQLDDDVDSGVTEIRVLSGDKIRRIKGVYTREKNRIYLRQFAEPGKDKWRIQGNVLAKYSISSISFSHMFVGEPPAFEDAGPPGESKFSQPSIETYLTKSAEKSKAKTPETAKKTFQRKADGGKRTPENLKDIRRKYEETIDKVVEQSRKDLMKRQALEDKARKLEELRKKREHEREEKARLASFVKEWQRKRDDLECEDLKELPAPCPVDCRLPNEHFGDAVMILEFFSSFREVLKVKDYFPFGLRFDVVERALVEVEIAGPFSDILQLLLASLFTLQEQEDDEIQSTDLHRSTDLEIDECGDISTTEAIKLATVAAGWSQIHHGVPLNKLSLDAITVSEVLRLHLLASGGRAGDRSAKWRYQERGGYTSTDDPCLMLRLKEPHILRFLAVRSVAELPAADKIKVLSCLMNQILTYAELRDAIDERYEKVKASKYELKTDQIAESKKEKELLAQRLREKKEAKEKGQAVPEESEEKRLRGAKESSRKKAEFHRRAVELQKAAMECHIVPLGQDRSYRRFWIFTTMGGLFVEDNEEWPGTCLSRATPAVSNPASIEEDTMSYLKKLYEEERNCGSDKENEGSSSHPVASPKKKLLSESNDLSNAPNPKTISPAKDEAAADEDKASRLVCTADHDTCFVHNRKKPRTRWLFYHKESDVEELVNCLNKRGYREHRLRKALLESRDNIVPRLSQCPVHLLNRFAVDAAAPSGAPKNTRSQKGYENANLKYPAGTPVQEILELYIRELILDTELKIYCGGLGTVKVKNRQAWREAIECRSYDRQDDGLAWRRHPVRKEKPAEKPKEEDASRPDTPCSLDSSSDQDVLSLRGDQSHVVKDLASAVLQIARSVEPKYLQKPLWEEKRKDKATAMERWESSLMSSTSFAQVYLHVATLENSIQWNKSALNARCKVCRRGGDGENMLLCDSCDRGFHLYCLKPKLTSIPKGDWFCLGCRPKERVEKAPKRSRRLFSEESDDDHDDDDDDDDGDGDDDDDEDDDEDDEDDRPLAATRGRRTRGCPRDPPKKRKYRKTEEEEEDSGDEPLSKIARTVRRSAQRKDFD